MDAEVLLHELDLKKISFIIYQKKWLILAITFVAFVSTFIYTFYMPATFVTSALIQVDSQLGSANNMQQILGSMDAPFGSNSQASPADIEIALIKSRFILQSVIEKLGLNIVITPHYFPVLGAAYARSQRDHQLAKPLFGLDQFAWGGEHVEIAQFNVDSDAAFMQFRLQKDDGDQFSLYLPDGKKILQGSLNKFVKTSPGVKPFVSIYIKSFFANKGANFTVALRLNDDVLKQLSSNLTIVDLGDTSKTKTGVLQLSFQGTEPKFIPKILNSIVDFAIARNIEKKSAEASKTLDFLNRQLPNVRKSLQNAETDLNEYRAKSGTIDISQEARIALMQLSAIEQSIAEVKLKKVEMLQELTPQHPFIIALKQKQLQLQKEVLNIENRIKTLPITDQRALSLERDVKVKDQLYLLLLNKIQQLQVLKAGTLSDVRILSSATIPILPLPSHRYFTLFSFSILGFAIGIAFVLLRDLFQRGVDDPERVEAKLKITSFAIIPHSPKQKELNSLMKRNIHLHKPFILARDDSKDIAVEGIRSLRTILQFTLLQSKNNIVSILGARPHIGKSFVAINLAQVLVDSGKSVLLLDADLRKGKLHQNLAQNKIPGLANLLQGNYDAYDKEIITPIASGFDFIATGEYPKNPSELLMSPRLDYLLTSYAKQYDIVIIDTPPILAVTDSVIIAKHSSVNLLVIGMGHDQLEELELSAKRVKKNGIEIQGLVFNSVNKIASQKVSGPYNYYYAYN